MNLTFHEAKEIAATLDAVNTRHSEILAAFPKTEMGLVPDHIRTTAEFQAAKSAFNVSFAELRKFNSWYVKQFKKELAAARASKYPSK